LATCLPYKCHYQERFECIQQGNLIVFALYSYFADNGVKLLAIKLSFDVWRSRFAFFYCILFLLLLKRGQNAACFI